MQGIPMKIGYVRVSTRKQDHQRQIQNLEAICDELHVETISAVSKYRPVFEAVIAKLNKGDTLVVHDLDRAFRSTVDALTYAEILKNRGVNFQILSMNIDTNTESGTLIYSVMAAFSQWERQCLQRRTREGMAAARKQGKHIGRPYKLSEEQIRTACARITLHQSTITAEAKKLGVCRDTLSKAIRRLEGHSSY